MFDKNLIFRDMETKEFFVFDINGIWNEDTLNHKLLHWVWYPALFCSNKMKLDENLFKIKNS